MGIAIICAGNCEKLRALRMKHGNLPILGIYSPGLYLIITHSRNKFDLLLWICQKSAKNHVFLDPEQPSNQQKESPQTFTIQQYSLVITSCTAQVYMDLSSPSIKLIGMNLLPSTPETKTGGMAAITPSFSFSSKLFMLQNYVVIS